jgi:hypothetical protein
MAKVGHAVLSLRRISIGTLHLGDLKEGYSRKLTQPELDALRRLARSAGEKRESSRKTVPAHARRRFRR